MKKTAIIILSILFLTSCGSKRKATSSKNAKKNQTIAYKKQHDTKVKPIKYKKNKELLIDVSKNKTVFNESMIDELYGKKSNLMKAKIDYIKKYSVLAIHEMEAYKIPASITLAQGLLESRYGKSVLTTKARNHFGIKCHKWQGDRVYHDDDEKGECFRKYQMHESSFRDHSLFLAHKKRYAKLFTFKPNDYKSWAKGLQKAGYATDKKYPQKLIALIENYDLFFFDKLVLGKEYDSNSLINKELVKKDFEHKKPNINKQPKKNNTPIKTDFYIVKSGETLYSISKRTNLSVDQIKKINNLTSTDLEIGQKLIFVIKNKSNTKLADNYLKYTVKTGDTLYSIASKNKMKVEDLKNLNNLKDNTLSIGQSIMIKAKKLN